MRQPIHATPDLGATLAPRRCEVCGRTLMPSGMEAITQMGEVLFAPLVEGLNQVVTGVLAPSRATRRRSARPHKKAHECGCRCDPCAPDECHCRCCIGDVDLVVYARLGERRIVPIIIENSRRRERQIRLELSDWTTRRGQPAAGVTAQLRWPTEFTLPPCEEREVVLEVNTAGEPSTSDDEVIVTDDFEESARATGEPSPPAPAAESEVGRLPDVDECEVFYADLRVTGCDIRPIRIALAILPRDCAAYEVDCRCGCC